MATIEEKARAYDIALDKIKRLLGTGSNCSREDLEYVFPELKESEDERIRKALIWHLTRVDNEIPLGAYHSIDGIEIKDMLAWLEKQGDQKPIIIPKFRVGDYVKDTNYHGEPIYKICDIDSRCYICFAVDEKNLGDRCVMHFSFDNPYIRLVEQKPAEWSEEDEIGFNDALWAIQQARTIAKDENDMGNLWYAEDWLKSIKERVQLQSQKQWKPSDEQINSLWDAIVYVEGCNSNFKGSGSVLENLYNDLKKLKG